MLRFACPSCGKKSKLPDEFAGQEAVCPYCDKTVTVPVSPPIESLTPAPPTRPTPPPLPEIKPLDLSQIAAQRSVSASKSFVRPIPSAGSVAAIPVPARPEPGQAAPAPPAPARRGFPMLGVGIVAAVVLIVGSLAVWVATQDGKNSNRESEGDEPATADGNGRPSGIDAEKESSPKVKLRSEVPDLAGSKSSSASADHQGSKTTGNKETAGKPLRPGTTGVASTNRESADASTAGKAAAPTANKRPPGVVGKGDAAVGNRTLAFARAYMDLRERILLDDVANRVANRLTKLVAADDEIERLWDSIPFDGVDPDALYYTDAAENLERRIQILRADARFASLLSGMVFSADDLFGHRNAEQPPYDSEVSARTTAEEFEADMEQLQKVLNDAKATVDADAVNRLRDVQRYQSARWFLMKNAMVSRYGSVGEQIIAEFGRLDAQALEQEYTLWLKANNLTGVHARKFFEHRQNGRGR